MKFMILSSRFRFRMRQMSEMSIIMIYYDKY